ncbi:MAG TPA: hypothetical protein VJI98_01015 [Candidatus Nanoarchaeia archaeon]|nr:hypothetical protein [Candidatus Nanoarchaeia archaeon]
MDNIKITLETLYDILRNEKKREDLQKLENTFFIDVVSYLREKQALLKEKENDDNLFAAGEKDKIEYELRSIKRIIKEIYEKREKKMIEIALNKSKTGSDIIDTSSMLREEKEFYNNLLKILDGSRREVLLRLYRGELPGFIPKTIIQEVNKNEILAEKTDVNEEMTKIEFIHPTPSFVWKDMKVYGPYEKGDKIDIFPEVAELLVRKKRAEKI